MNTDIPSRLVSLLEERRQDIERFRSKGGKVLGYVCSKVPVEIPYAMGIMPIRIGIADQERMETGKAYVHQYTCPYIKCITGEMLTKGDFFHDNVDILSGSVACMTAHRCLEVIRQYSGKSSFYITHPLNFPGEKEIKFYNGEIHDFVRRLEEATREKLDAKRLENSVLLFNGIRERLKKLYRLLSSGVPPLRWSHVFSIIQGGFILDPYKYLTFLDEILEESEAIKTGPRSPDEAPRIMLLGSPVLPGDTLLVDTIENCGARIVADNLCTGLRTFEGLIIEEPTLEGIAKTYLKSNPCVPVQDLEVDGDRRLNNIFRLIQEYNVRGVVYYALRFCDPYAFKDKYLKKRLADKAGIPMIAVHSEYGNAERGRIQTRIQGFIETL